MEQKLLRILELLHLADDPNIGPVTKEGVQYAALSLMVELGKEAQKELGE